MAKEKSPAFQFYPREYQGDENVKAMSLAERGAYMDLLCVCWTEGSIPADMKRLARIVGVTAPEMEEMWEFIGPCFEADPDDPDRLRHSRLDAERQKQREWREQKRAAGKASARARARKAKGGKENEHRSNDRSTHAQQQGKLETEDSKQENYPNPNDAVGGNYPEEFERAWKAYPSRDNANKKESYRAWLATVRRGVDPADILAGVEKYAAKCAAERTEPQYIKQPKTFFGPDDHWAVDWKPERRPQGLTPDAEEAARRRKEEEAQRQREVEADQLRIQRWKRDHPEEFEKIEQEEYAEAGGGTAGRFAALARINSRVMQRIEEDEVPRAG